MISKFLFLLMVIAPVYTIAATAGGEAHGIPWKTVGVQAFNFILLFSLIFYLVKETVVSHFKERKRAYTELVGKAEAAKKEAEANHREVSARLQALENSAKENAAKAKAEAEALKMKLLKEADELAEKLTLEAKKTASIEVQKAKAEIRNFALTQAIEAAENKLSSNASQDDQSRLQSEFIRKIQMVSQ